MDGTAAARPLTRASRTAPPRITESCPEPRHYVVSAARKEDDAEIRHLLRRTAMPGEIRLSLEREPDCFAAGPIEGDVHELIVARDRSTGAVAAVASRAVRDAYVNGVVTRVGYLGQLRIARDCMDKRELLDAGFRFCRQVHESDDAAIYLASVVADNEPARRLLARRRSGWPEFSPVGRLTTLALPVRRHTRPAAAARVRIVRGSPALLDRIVACLERHGRRHQFSPRWTAEDLLSATRTRGLELDDFAVALRGDAVVGCMACWDQRAFKQVVVRGYVGALACARPFVNALARVSGGIRLPAVGSAFDFAFLSHVAIDDDDPDLLAALVAGACSRAREAGLEYVAVGVASGSRLVRTIASTTPHREYESIVYLASWPDSERLTQQLDGRAIHPELAVL